MTAPTQDDLQTRLAAALLVYLESQKPEPAPEDRRAEIRRWYAGQALQGAMASFAGTDTVPTPGRFAEIAFELADAMMTQEDL